MVHPVRYHQGSLYIPYNPDQTSYFIAMEIQERLQILEKVCFTAEFLFQWTCQKTLA